MSKNSASHEYCQGYVDKNGIWNNGFYCRRWGGQDVTYCCGDGQDRFCCPELTHLVTPTTDSNSPLPADSFNYIPVVIGLCIVVMVVFVIAMTTTLCCLFCSCCPVKKRQRLRKQSSSIVINGTLPFCTEAEATSSVIAAEALQMPFRDFALCTSTRFTGASTAFPTRGQSPTSSFDNRRRCEEANSRPWSPTASLGTTEDLDSTITSSLYHKCDLPEVTWHTEVQNLCNCECRPILKLEPKRSERTNVLLCSTGSPISFQQSTGYSSAWKLDSFGAKRPQLTKTDKEEAPPSTKQTTFELSNQRSSPFPASDVIVSSSSQGRWQSKLRLPMSFVTEAERHKRDSGVLVEEQDTSDNSGSAVCVGLASEDQLTIVRSVGPRSEYTWKKN